MMFFCKKLNFRNKEKTTKKVHAIEQWWRCYLQTEGLALAYNAIGRLRVNWISLIFLIPFLFQLKTTRGQNIWEGEITMYQRLELDHWGTAKFKYEKEGPDEVKITYEFLRKKLPNPINLSNEFKLTIQKNELLVSPEIILSPTDIYFDTSIDFSREGMLYSIPRSPILGEQLEDINCDFKLSRFNDEFIDYSMEVTNRHVIEIRNLDIGGKDYKTYVIDQKVVLEKYLFGKLNLKSEEKVELTFIPEIGIVCINRSPKIDLLGNDITTHKIKLEKGDFLVKSERIEIKSK